MPQRNIEGNNNRCNELRGKIFHVPVLINERRNKKCVVNPSTGRFRYHVRLCRSHSARSTATSQVNILQDRSIFAERIGGKTSFALEKSLNDIQMHK